MEDLEKQTEEALNILVNHLELSDVRKYTCINKFGHSQLERDIVESQKQYWQQGMYTEEEVRKMCKISFEFHRTNEFDDDELEIEWGKWFEQNKKK